MELEDRVHPVPHVDDLASRQDREAEGRESEGGAKAVVGRPPERRTERDEKGDGSEEPGGRRLHEPWRMEGEGRDGQGEGDRREDQERTRGPPTRDGARLPRIESEREEERDEERPHVEEVPRPGPRAHLAAPVPGRWRETCPERAREERGRERDTGGRQEDAARKRPGRRGQSGWARPEPEDAGKKEEEARIDGGRPAVRDLERGEEEAGESDERDRVTGSERGEPIARDEEEKDRHEGRGEGQREDVRVEVREEEAPEEVLADPVRGDDARGRPEVVPVEGTARLVEVEIERGPRTGGRREDEREQHRDGARAEAPAERGAGREDRGGRQRGRHRDREVEEEAGVDAEELPGGRGEEVTEVGVREGRAGEPRLGRRKLGGPKERVQEREVHRLLAEVDLGVRGADGEEEEERAPEDERRLPALRRGRRGIGEMRAAVAEEAGGEERGRRDDEEAPRERRPVPRDDEPRHEREEEDAGDAPERVAARPRGEEDGEDSRARAARRFEPRGEEKQREEGEPEGRDTATRLRGRIARDARTRLRAVAVRCRAREEEIGRVRVFDGVADRRALLERLGRRGASCSGRTGPSGGRRP